MGDYIEDCISEHIKIIQKHQGEIIEKVSSFSKKLVSAFQSGNKALLAGNGGSAADAQHIAAEFIGRFQINRPSLPAIALTTDSSVLTSVGNDFGFMQVFSRQVEGLGKKGDVLMVFSTSGNSENLLRSVEIAKKKEIITLGFIGKDGGKLKNVLDDCILIASESTPRVQEVHITVGHIICDIVEKTLYNSYRSE